MLIIPAIDILDGKCVRLYKGDYSNVTTYGSDAAEVASDLEKAGAERIHIVDLDAARGGGKRGAGRTGAAGLAVGAAGGFPAGRFDHEPAVAARASCWLMSPTSAE